MKTCDESCAWKGDLKARAPWNAPADIAFVFKQNSLRKVLITLKQPPALGEAIADYEQRFGKPLEKRIARQEEVSRIRWQFQQPAALLHIVMTEAQGTLTIAYEYEARK